MALAELARSDYRLGVTQYTAQVELDDDNQKRIDSEGKAFEDVALWLTNAILCSIVESLGLTGLRMTPAFAGQLLDIREMFNAKFVSFYDMDLSLVSAPLLHSLLELMEKCVFKISLGNAQPPRGEHYKISADTILDFCFGHEGRKSVSRGLELGHVEFPPEFDDAIFERHKQSALKSHLYLKIHDIRLEQQYSVDSTYPGASSMPL
ncbi:hypothetical protein AAVH_11629 [Aphelenchoides avenae]|nr:hypothetical protein AAVH_11629 [Aphelenchus avenae]